MTTLSKVLAVFWLVVGNCNRSVELYSLRRWAQLVEGAKKEGS